VTHIILSSAQIKECDHRQTSRKRKGFNYIHGVQKEKNGLTFLRNLLSQF